MSAPFTPIAGRVLLEPLEPDRTTDAGLILVEDRKPETMGRVVAVAEAPAHEHVRDLRAALSQALSMSQSDTFRATWLELLKDTVTPDPEVNVGDIVLFSWTSGQEIRLDDARYLIMPESDILAVVEDYE